MARFELKADLAEVDFVAVAQGDTAAGVRGDIDAAAFAEESCADGAAVVEDAPFVGGGIEAEVGVRTRDARIGFVGSFGKKQFVAADGAAERVSDFSFASEIDAGTFQIELGSGRRARDGEKARGQERNHGGRGDGGGGSGFGFVALTEDTHFDKRVFGVVDEDGEVVRRCDAFFFERGADVVAKLAGIEDRLENGFAFGIFGGQLDGDAVEGEDAVAAFAGGGAVGDLIERVAVKLNGFPCAGLVFITGEDGAQTLVERSFYSAKQTHGISFNCCAATTRSPAMGAAAVPP